MQGATEDWTSRIARLQQEKEQVEKTEYGVKVELLVRDFFVSEHVIPKQNKIYKDGVLQEFNLQGLNKSHLVIREVFRRKHFADNFVATNIQPIKIRLFALFHILKFVPDKDNKQEIYAYKSALLGAIASLFTALEDNTVFDDVLNDQFKKWFRNMVFHFGHVTLEREPVERLRLVAIHIYEHCRQELACHYNKFPSLANQMKDADKYKAHPNNDIQWIIIGRCLNAHSIFYEYNKSLAERLAKQKAALAEMIQHFNKHPATHSVGRFPEETALAIRGNAIGLHVACLSGGAAALLKDRTWDKAAAEASGDDKSKPVVLDEKQKQQIRKDYGEFINVGGAFRHNRLPYMQLPKQFQVKISLAAKDTKDQKMAASADNKHTYATTSSSSSSAPAPAPAPTPAATPASAAAAAAIPKANQEKQRQYPYRQDALTNNAFTATLALLEEKLAKLEKDEKDNFVQIRDLVSTSLQLMEEDIYPDDDKSVLTSKTKKMQLLQAVCKRVEVFLAGNPTTEEIADLLFLLSVNNLKYYYDYTWLYDEKCQLFLPIVQKLAKLLSARLAQPNTFSANTVSNAIAGLAAWNIPLPENLIEGLLLVADRLHQQKIVFSPQQAFLILEGLRKANYRIVPNTTHNHASLFVALANAALPLLARKDLPPLQMFDSSRLAYFRASYVERLLPPLYEPWVFQREIFPRILELSRTLNRAVSENEVTDKLPLALVPNRELIKALRLIQGEGLQATDEELEKREAWEKDNNYQNRYPLKTLQKCIQIIYKENNPRGLIWLIKRYSENLLSDIQHKEDLQKIVPKAADFMRLHPADVKDFLKTIRNYSPGMAVPHIVATIAKLCAEAVIPCHLAIIDNDLAISLLWINMVFTVLADDQRIAFSPEHRKALLKKITSADNEEQCRDLFELRALKWLDDTKLEPGVEKQMQAKLAGFAKGANPSLSEKQYYSYIRKLLPASHQKYLLCNHICAKTGMEIDIVYRDEKHCIAININGPMHLHPLLGTPTLKTSFRHKCLASAGWKSFDINLVLRQSKTVALKDVVAELESAIGQKIILPVHPRPASVLNRPCHAPQKDDEKNKRAKLKYPLTIGILSTVGEPALWQFVAQHSSLCTKLFRK